MDNVQHLSHIALSFFILFHLHLFAFLEIYPCDFYVDYQYYSLPAISMSDYTYLSEYIDGNEIIKVVPPLSFSLPLSDVCAETRHACGDGQARLPDRRNQKEQALSWPWFNLLTLATRFLVDPLLSL